MEEWCGTCKYSTKNCSDKSCQGTNLYDWEPKKSHDRIICLVGESGSGKTTIAKALYDKGYNVIQSYTTRQPREPNEWGHTFIEFSERSRNDPQIINETRDFIKAHNPIAYTYYNGEHYWATAEQYQGKGNTIYVIDPVGVDKLKEVVKDAEIIVIYLKCDEVVRLARMLNRGDSSDKAHERIENDEEAFKTVKCDIAIDSNGEICRTIELVEQYLKSM